ncbi:hypothetical protein OIU74_027489 [Salix koriyanagi]|uniref:Uncharacterized protein n=1 Tax=Salix koriyanagi TaxID=2511006 RepID=A0A9Q0VQB6_9ROSI|nr:hypothetical protein OIU74_027489 [Salix koriyanagi]
MDRLRQAEKKRRRLEKALATSAAIRSELEQKKQKKKEEQQRLDEEGAAIAEAVALHVLLGEDSDDSWNSFERIGWVPSTCGTGCQWGERETNDLSFSYESLRGGVPVQYFDDGSWGTTEFSAGLIAAQAVSSLQIAEDAHGDSFLFDGMLRG